MKMKPLLTLAVVALACALFTDAALAKRMGGGGSFGSKSTYSRSYSPAPSAPYSPSAPAQPGQMSRSATPTPTPPLAQPSGGMFGRMGWGLGGFMAGGLIGSMLFGHGGGFGGGGGGIGMLDILLIGLALYLGYRLLRSRTNAANVPGQRTRPEDLRPPRVDARTQAAQNWEQLRTTPSAGAPAGQADAASATGGFGVNPVSETAEAPVVPAGFSVPDFLEGAKTVYARLQHSWDRRDLSDIALFTTAEVLAEIRQQANADPTPSKTELLLVNAKLLEFKEEPADTVATVLFDVLMREDADEQRPKQIREVWHFSRPTADLKANWRLEGIQQLEG